MSAEPEGKWEEGRRKGKSLRLGEKSETVLRVASFSAHNTKAVWEVHLLDRREDLNCSHSEAPKREQFMERKV